jgi:UDP-N-acetylmuramoylalanine--D-glutamate ligase
MIPVTGFRDSQVAVFGLGRSGLAAARALCAGGARVLAGDDASERLAEAERLGARALDLAAADWSAIRALVLSPGVPLTFPVPHPVVRAARAAGVEVIGDVELLGRAMRAQGGARAGGPRFVGITGTNGKSTTTVLLGHMLARAGRAVQVGGNIGAPALALEPLGADGVYVLEMSSFQLDLTCGLVFDVAALLNLTPDHLDRHGGMDRYLAAKRRVFAGQTAACSAVIALDDLTCAAVFDELAQAGRRRLIPVSTRRALERGVTVEDGVLFDSLDGAPRRVIALAGIATLPGAHNWQNAAVAYGAARALGLDAAAAADGLASYPGLAHRLELVATRGGVRFVNDSKATNAMAAAQALACFEHVHWIAGGRAKGDDLSVLEPALGSVARAYLIGEAAPAFARALAGRVPVTVSGELASAVAAAAAAARGNRPGTAVLLSPACASFDQFRDFEERGERFRALVEALPETDVEAGA